MVVVKGNRELRSFAVVGAQRDNGCATKFNEDSRLVSATPVSAAKVLSTLDSVISKELRENVHSL